MFSFLILFHVLFIINVPSYAAEISDKRLCANKECTQLIALGKTIIPYATPSKDSRLLSFKIGQDVKIYSRGAGSNPNLVGVEINGKRGYIPKDTFLETSVKVVPTFEEDVENVELSHNADPPQSINPEPSKPLVVEGTTISYEDTINMESATQPNLTDTNKETQPLDSNSIPKTVQEGVVPIPVTTETSNIISDAVQPLGQNSIDSPKADEEESKENAESQIQQVALGTTVTEAPLETQDSKPQIIPVTEVKDSIVNNLLVENLMSEGDDSSGEEDDEGSTEEIEDEDGLVEEEVEYEKASSKIIEISSLPPAGPTKPKDSESLPELHSESTVSSSESNITEDGSTPLPETLQQKVEDICDENTKPEAAITISSSEPSMAKNELQSETTVSSSELNSAENGSPPVEGIGVENSSFEPIKPTDPQQFVYPEMSPEHVNVEENLVSEQRESETPPNSSFFLENYMNVNTSQEQEKEVFNQLNINDKPQDQSTTSYENMELKENQTEYLQDASEVEAVRNEVAEEISDVFKYDQQNIEMEMPFSEVNEEKENDNSNYANDQQTFKEETGNEVEQQNKLETETVNRIESHKHDLNSLISQHIDDTSSCSADPLRDCNIGPQDFRAAYDTNNIYKIPNSAILTVLVIAAVTVVTFLWGYIYMEKRGRESNLVGKINNIQKEYLIVQKQNEMLKDKLEDVEVQFNEKANAVSNEMLLAVQEQLEKEKNSSLTLELQVQNLEKELENSTEVGLELNRMLSEFLNSENGSETLVANIEQLQRQVVEQQGIINTYNENLSMKETENHELRLEVDINNTKVTELQSELNKMALNLLKFEEDKEQLQSTYEGDLEKVKEELESKKGAFLKEKNKLKEQLQDLKDQYEQVHRDYELKCNEYIILKEGISQIKKIENNGDALKSLLDMSTIQAELLQLRKEKQLLMEQLQDERNKSGGYELKCQSVMKDLESFKEMYDEADREKVEAVTKLQVLDKYFKEREAQLQKELNKQESMWIEKQGEATSTIERIKYMQEELQNYKIQNESLKQEILEQEVQMKSQISVLEKKAHENWVTARQAERKLEDAKQEAAQLRNRLTLRERSFAEDKIHNRVQSPLEHNGEVPVSPSHISNDTAASPPLLYGTRENLTISPPLPGLPFLPPPPGVPFMPPSLGGVPLPPPGFMPPPPSLMPVDHRPPPLGRISSPPLNSRYSPDRGYSPYSRNSPSPISDDDYDRIPHPPMYRGYNSYNRDDRREIHRPPPARGSTRNNKGGGHSSASTNSNDSLDKINRHNSKISPLLDYHYEF